MSKSKNKNIENSLFYALNEIQNKTSNENTNIVDIITFCQDSKLLNLPGNNFHLWISQRVILKCFYMGSRGNENLNLTKEEWDWLHSKKEDEILGETKYIKNINNVIEKIETKIREQNSTLLNKNKDEYKKYNFDELNLVLGRRSSKTVIASIITSYEIYKLLVINNGDPHGYYKLPNDDVITALNVALSQQQAGKLFGEIQNRLRGSAFFKGKIASQTTSEIRLYTKKDLELKEKGSSIDVKGSISILCGHSNPASLRGLSTILILFDEMAFFDESGKVTGSKFYQTLAPSRSNFIPYGDAKIVQISSPHVEFGIFYETYKSSKKNHQILSFQLPTWDVNPEITYEKLKSEREKNPESFPVEYGAQWMVGGNKGPYFEEGLINRCIRTDLEHHSKPKKSTNYYLHVDPANGGDRYAAVLVAKYIYANNYGQKRAKIELANTWIFTPQPGVGLVFNEIDKMLLNICRYYKVLTVSVDDFQSAHTIQFLRSNGVNIIKTQFTRIYKNIIYQNLKDLMSYHPEPELRLYDDPNGLLTELRGIRFKPSKKGNILRPDYNSELPYDDLVDCLAGAAAIASGVSTPALPLPVIVKTGFI